LLLNLCLNVLTACYYSILITEFIALSWCLSLVLDAYSVILTTTTSAVFTALHGMQMQSSDENSVCLSVCPSHSWIDKTAERSVQIYIPYERTFSLVF